MKKVMNNQTHIEGYVYDHSLELKTSGENSKNPGTQFIAGNLGIATDEDMMNVVQVHFTYVTAVTSKGKPNATFNTLQAIIDGKIPNAMVSGKENAARVRIDSALALNEWYDNRTEGSPLVSVKRNEGGFVHQLTIAENLNPAVEDRATFDCDMLITKVTRVEANEERNTPEKVVLKGYIFDFRNSILPVEFSVVDGVSPNGAMDYFEDLDISSKNPLFTRIKGRQISQTIERTVEEESAFGEASVRIVRSSQRDFVVTWAAKEPYVWDDETTLLGSEVEKALADREVTLADMKKRQEEYQASRGNALGGNSAPAATAAPKKSDYNF